MTKPSFDKFADRYDILLRDTIPTSLNDDTYFAEYKVRLIASIMRGLKPKRVLDFGCGAGRSLPFLKKHFPHADLYGYDPSPASLDLAAKRSGDAILSANWKSIGKMPFDMVFAANVFHHIPKSVRVTALVQCCESLVPEGSVFLFEHNPFNPATRWVFERCPFDADAEMISMGDAKRMAEDAGLRVVRHGYTLFFPRPLALLRSIEPLFKHVPLGAQYYVQLAK